MISVHRLGHVTLSTPDIERQLDYYRTIIGLAVIEQTPQRAVLATRLGVETLVLERGATAGLSRIALEVAPGVDLAAMAGQIAAQGMRPEIRTGITPGIDRALVFADPHGTPLELFAGYRFAPMNDRRPAGIMPVKLGHVARFVDDVHASERFYCGVLGFRTSDWRTDTGVFMRCGPDHHTINTFAGADPGLAHIAFEVKDFAELQRTCDVLAQNDLKLDWGPSRHNIGHNIACYHRNWDGLRVEFYTEMDQMKDEALGYFEPRPWHETIPLKPQIWPESTSKNYWGLWGAR